MKTKKITFIDLVSKYKPFVEQFHKDLDRVLASGTFILGQEVLRFEESIKHSTKTAGAIGVGNGTDALILCLKAMNIGPRDEVITTSMSYLATASSIALVGATAVCVDIDNSLNLDPDKIEAAITPQTRAILVVHLSGIPADVDQIMKIASRHGLPVIEDCAQAFGAEISGQAVGTFGRLGTISFHPLKNLGTLGDGGIILAQREEDIRWLEQARNHGHKNRDECDFWSINSRLDELHAAFLNTMLEYYPEEVKRRQRLADIYKLELKGLVKFPLVPPGAKPSFNWIMMLVDQREELVKFLAEQGTELKIHYPYLMPDLKSAVKNCRVHGSLENSRNMVKKIISVPAAEHISESDVRYICEQIKNFYAKTPLILNNTH
jgi:dTDP-4-amino-4,6-dideoxygalactose transaminase